MRALVAALVLVAAPALADAPASGPDRPGLSPDARVLRIGWRLAVANAAVCRHTRSLSGLSLHDLSAYAARDRDRVAQAYGLGWGFGVLDLAPASPAAAAGLAPGDEITGADGTVLSDFARAGVRGGGSPARVSAFEDWLAARLAKGPVALTVRRGGATFATTLTGVTGCADYVVADPGRAIDAWSDGTNVAVTAGLADLLPEDDQLAFVIAHEMAHNLLGHVAALRGHSRFLAAFGIASGPFSRSELEADAMGLKLAARAGYDWHAAAPALQRIIARRGDLGGDHPLLQTRLRAIALCNGY